jgi:MerR family transcriptional regulator, light-induced transcriptional regulator
MNDRAPMKPPLLTIAAVERDTGLSKDTLRVWERRYGYPAPERDAVGERAYPLEQVEKLRIVKRLLDGGHRPGRVVGLSVEALQRLSDSLPALPRTAAAPAPVAALDLHAYLAMLRAHDVIALRRMLAQAQMRLGMARFVSEVVAPLNTLIGDAWMRGQLEIFEEHAYTESIQVVLRQAIANLPDAAADDRPRVLLSTLPGEPHGLGLLMAEAMLAIEGARCLSLGVQTPVWDLVLAAKAHHCDIVALSFSGCMNPNAVIAALAELRSKLPAVVEVWAGGLAPVLHRRAVDGVHAIATFHDLPGRIGRWRSR